MHLVISGHVHFQEAERPDGIFSPHKLDMTRILYPDSKEAVAPSLSDQGERWHGRRARLGTVAPLTPRGAGLDQSSAGAWLILCIAARVGGLRGVGLGFGLCVGKGVGAVVQPVVHPGPVGKFEALHDEAGGCAGDGVGREGFVR